MQWLANKSWTFTTGTTVAAGPKPVILGTAANYAILAKTGVSNRAKLRSDRECRSESSRQRLT